MTRNQKIALGCGGAGCLGLIVVLIAGCVIYFFYYGASRRYSAGDYNYNFNVNSNSNSNDNSDLTSNSNENSNSTDNSNSSSSSSSSDSMSEEDKHKLYQAALMTGDPEIVQRVSVKIGLMEDDYTPGPEHQRFVAAHVGWAIRNSNFTQTIDTPDKARAYVNEHFPE